MSDERVQLGGHGLPRPAAVRLRPHGHARRQRGHLHQHRHRRSARTSRLILPADLDGSILPPAGAPELVRRASPAPAAYNIYHFHVDFATPANSTFTIFASPAAAGFTQLCPSHPRLRAPARTATALDAIGDRLMFRLAYRNFATATRRWSATTPSARGGVAGIRWFELRNVTAGPVTRVPGEHLPARHHLALDGQRGAWTRSGNMAVGFSASSSTHHPAAALRRAAGDRSAQHAGPGRSRRSSPAPAARPAPATAGATTAT